ncbi:FAD-binding oxidoreductase [Acidobacteria bacterium AH-259-A15]|nr:FAD-binding oxidoreductase [Acidobacteria bacterium AH-259-A15]
MKKTAEVVVIGAGINGCSIAYNLAKDGVRNVLLVEKGYVASGPTGRSSGIVRQHYTIETLAKMARDSLRTYRSFEQEIGGDAGFMQAGVVFLCSEQNAETLKKSVAMHQRLGIRESVLSPEELREMEPFLNIEDIGYGAYEPDGGYADPALAANSFCIAAQKEGVEVLLGTRVTGLRVQGAQIRGVITDKGEIATETVVNVAGPWGREIAAMVGVEIPIKPSRHPVVILKRPPQWRTPTPVWADLVNGWYFKPEGHDGMLVGSISSQEADQEADVEKYSVVTDYDEAATYSDGVLRRFPVMAEGLVKGGWAGLYDVTPDWQPVIDQIPEVKGFYCAVGFSGHGFKLGPAVGRIVSELVRKGKCSSYDTTVFRYRRFHNGQLSAGDYHEYKILG